MRTTFVRHPESVSIVALSEHELVVVVQRRPGAPDLTVELPAGCLEPGEGAAVAAAREPREECSLAARLWQAVGSFWAAPAYSNERVHVFEARDLFPAEGQSDDDEEIVVRSRPIAEMPADLSDATSIAAWALWARRRGG
ncbi:MAG: NUDIX hydrolase [Solirubrobacteraceae bacterium]